MKIKLNRLLGFLKNQHPWIVMVYDVHHETQCLLVCAAGVFVFLGGVSTWEVARCAKRSCGFGGITRIAIAETTGGACAPILCGDVHALP